MEKIAKLMSDCKYEINKANGFASRMERCVEKIEGLILEIKSQDSSKDDRTGDATGSEDHFVINVSTVGKKK